MKRIDICKWNLRQVNECSGHAAVGISIVASVVDSFRNNESDLLAFEFLVLQQTDELSA